MQDEEAVGPDEATASAIDHDDIDVNASDYADFLKDAEKDDAIGDQDFMVTSKVIDQWPSGDPRIKIRGKLVSVPGQNKPQADLTISPPPAPSVIKAESASWDSRKKKAIASAIQIYDQLKKFYGKKPSEVQEGDVFRVKIVRTRRDEAGQGGFLRIVAFKDKAGIGEVAKDITSVPF